MRIPHAFVLLVLVPTLAQSNTMNTAEVTRQQCLELTASEPDEEPVSQDGPVLAWVQTSVGDFTELADPSTRWPAAELEGWQLVARPLDVLAQANSYGQLGADSVTAQRHRMAVAELVSYQQRQSREHSSWGLRTALAKAASRVRRETSARATR